MPESKTKRSPSRGPKLQNGGRDARKVAALILEVLAGQLHPSEAAKAVGVGLPRYYQMEKRGLEGLIAGCEAVPKGPGPEKRVLSLEKRIRQLERDVARYQALARTSQKVLGATASKSKKGGRKRRTPVVRALKIAKGIRRDDAEDSPMIMVRADTSVDSNGG